MRDDQPVRSGAHAPNCMMSSRWDLRTTRISTLCVVSTSSSGWATTLLRTRPANEGSLFPDLPHASLRKKETRVPFSVSGLSVARRRFRGLAR